MLEISSGISYKEISDKDREKHCIMNVDAAEDFLLIFFFFFFFFHPPLFICTAPHHC